MLNDLVERGGKVTRGLRRCVESGHGSIRHATAFPSPAKGQVTLTLTDFSVYGGLFASAFLAATILPLSSEAVLAGLLAMRPRETALLLAVATVGNTLGSVVNWLLGRGLESFRDRPWFPLNAQRYAAAEGRFRRYGMWSLLFAWFPVIGDALTVAAGVLRAPFLPFLILVAIGKAARYAAIAAGLSAWAGL